MIATILCGGLNVTSYDFKFEDEFGVNTGAAGVIVPLPILLVTVGYRYAGFTASGTLYF